MKSRFLEAYDTHADGVYRYGLYKLSDSNAALDLVQDTFLRYWDTLRKGETIEYERAFLFTIARRLIIDRYRAKKTESLEELAEEQGFEPIDSVQFSPEELAGHTELLDFVAQLPETYREVITLRYLEGLEPREIASMLGESANAITVRIHRGVAKLREYMHEKKYD